MDHAGMLDDVGLGDVLLQVFLQQSLHHHRVRPVSTEERRSLKRPRAGVKREMLRIDGDAREQRRRLQRAELHLLVNVLQQLRNELARRGSVRLQIDEHRIGHEFFPAAMVVHDDDATRFFDQPGLHRDGSLMRINEHE
ncbi:hypothetical protein D3C74_300400 [compost metagenome]